MKKKNYENIVNRIKESLETIRPYLQSDGGDISLEEVTEDFVVKVKLLGACGNCPMSIQTLKAGVEHTLKTHIPEVKEVVQVKDFEPDSQDLVNEN